jgi:RimJ/RimL family protein N-acetyltransferase
MDLLVTARLLPLTDAGGPTGLTEVGWHLHPDHQDQGLATEAAAALLRTPGLP